MDTKDTTINKENFQSQWEYVTNKIMELKQKRVIKKTVSLVGNLVFLIYC